MSAAQSARRAPLSADEQQRNRVREGLQLSHRRLTHQLTAATNPRHREMLTRAIAELDLQLASFDKVTDSSAQK